jgi:hypothetical protein
MAKFREFNQDLVYMKIAPHHLPWAAQRHWHGPA